MRKALFLLPLLVLLYSCSSQKGGVKLDRLLDAANSSRGKNLISLASGNYLPTVNTNRKRYYSVDKTVVADDNKPSTSLP